MSAVEVAFTKPDGPIGYVDPPTHMHTCTHTLHLQHTQPLPPPYTAPRSTCRLKAGEIDEVENWPVIMKLVPGSTADQQHLIEVGDWIMSLNGVEMNGKTGSDVHDVVRETEAGDQLRFIIRAVGPRREESASAYKTHTLSQTDRDAGHALVTFIKPLGVLGMIAGRKKGSNADAYPIIDNFVPGSFAHQQEGLELDFLIISVNGTDMQGACSVLVAAVCHY